LNCPDLRQLFVAWNFETGLFIRHIIVEKNGRYIGLLSIGDVLRASLMEQDLQIKELNAMASWEYYENWGWDRKRGIPDK